MLLFEAYFTYQLNCACPGIKHCHYAKRRRFGRHNCSQAFNSDTARASASVGLNDRSNLKCGGRSHNAKLKEVP